MKRLQLEGRRFGRLIVLERSLRLDKRGHPVFFTCVCDCGNKYETRGTSLNRGTVKSCGCFNKDSAREHQKTFHKHGHAISGKHTPEFDCWQSFKARCLRTTHPQYPDYGGRGISVFPLWVNDFMAFYEHVGPRPSSKFSLDRIDNNKGYEPGNVRWASRSEQQRNRRYYSVSYAEGLKAKLALYESRYGKLEVGHAS